MPKYYFATSEMVSPISSLITDSARRPLIVVAEPYVTFHLVLSITKGGVVTVTPVPLVSIFALKEMALVTSIIVKFP